MASTAARRVPDDEFKREFGARIHAKVKDTRRYFLHKLSSKLINENQVIGIKDLCLKGMHRSRLSKSISDTGLGELRK